MDINMVTTDVHRGVLQEIRDSGNVHRCDRYDAAVNMEEMNAITITCTLSDVLLKAS